MPVPNYGSKPSRRTLNPRGIAISLTAIAVIAYVICLVLLPYIEQIRALQREAAQSRRSGLSNANQPKAIWRPRQ